MITKCFTKNEDGKIEFTEEELKELLDEVYNEGYRDQKLGSTWVYTTPGSSWLYTHNTNIVL